MTDQFVWPSDAARAESEELSRTCEYAEQLEDRLAEVERERDAYKAAAETMQAAAASCRKQNKELAAMVGRLQRENEELNLLVVPEIQARAVEAATKVINLRGVIRSNATDGLMLEVKTQLQQHAQQLRNGEIE